HRAFGQVDVDVLALEDRRLDAIGRAARLHEAEGRLDALVHHFAELARRPDLALPRGRDAFDRQQLAAHFGPSQAGDRADLCLLVGLAVAELAHPGKVAEVLGRDDDAFHLLLEDLAQRSRRQPRALALWRADASSAASLAYQVDQTDLGELALVLLQPVRFDMPDDQVLLGDLDLHVLRASLETDELHAVERVLLKVERVG